MDSWTNGLLITSLVGLFQCFLAQNCEFPACSWTIAQGFIPTNYSQIQREIGAVLELENKVDDFGYCSDTDCRIRSPWLIPDASKKTVCLFLDVYAGLKQYGGSNLQTGGGIVKGLLKISVTTEDGVDEKKLQNISHLHHNRWDTLSTRFDYLDEKFRIVIEVILGEDAGFLAVDNIALVTNCASTANYSQVNKTHSCTGVDSLMCDDLHCVRRDQLCNLQSDCDNGKDEGDVYCSQLPFGMQCSFETGWCGWIRFIANAPLNWTRHNGPTPTDGTGPSFDHTYGNATGYYMYFESGQGKYMDDAVLMSRVFYNRDVLPGCKLRFFYHFLGRRPGKLEVSIINWCRLNSYLKPWVRWRQMRTQGNQWIYQEIPIANRFKRYTVQFTASKGFGDHGDIAVDDVTFSPQCYGYRVTAAGLTRTSPIEEPLPLRTLIQGKPAICQDNPDSEETTTSSENNDTTDDAVDSVTSSSAAPHAIISPTVNSSENISSATNPIKMLKPVKETQLPPVYIVIIVVAAVIVAFVMGSTILCLALRRKKGGSVPSGHLEIRTDDPDDTRLPPPVQPSSFDMQLRCTVTELNPNYDFINAKYPEHQLREIPRNKIKLTKLIGQGAFGEVYEGTLKNLCANVDQLQVAVKTLPALCSDQAETDFMMEAIIISKFMHKNVVKCLGVCFEDHPRYIILELLQGGDLRSFLRDSRPKENSICLVTMEDLVRLALDIANGCRHLEEKRFIHRDIAARNCLLTSRSPERIAKIADFGMSRDIYSADYYRKGGKTLLPIKWMPPEAFLDGVFTTKTDVWSFGILLWEIFTLGYMPYPGQTNTDVMHFVASGGRLDPPDNCPARLNKIMIMCWNSVADIRPSFSEIIEHLDMCLQDPEVMNADLSECHFHIGEYFKDAATLARSSPENTIPSPSIDMEDITSEFRGHVESQSTEPLLAP